MKRLLDKILFLSLVSLHVYGQGTLTFSNRGAPTYLGSTNGPFAGPSIWGQALVGLTADSLVPMGIPIEHRVGGALSRGLFIDVPGTTPGDSVFVQMAAWDGTLWGTNIVSVPAGQFGYTDIVSVFLSSDVSPVILPVFTLSAIVPQVPEPSSAVTILMFCGGAWFWRIRQRHRHRPAE